MSDDTLEFTKPGHAILFNVNGRELVRVAYDGTITYGEGYEPDAVARAFWQSLGEARPSAEETRLRAKNVALRAVLRETLEIARRNESGDYIGRALAAMGEQ